MSSPCSFAACCTAEADFERIETVFVYTTPQRMPKTELSREAPADPTASQEVNSTYAREECVPLEEAVSDVLNRPLSLTLKWQSQPLNQTTLRTLCLGQTRVTQGLMCQSSVKEFLLCQTCFKKSR